MGALEQKEQFCFARGYSGLLFTQGGGEFSDCDQRRQAETSKYEGKQGR